MKKLIVTFLTLFAMAIPWQASAQTNVKKAFDKLLNSTDVEMQKESHQMSKNPQSGKKESMFAMYYFSLPESKEKLIKEVLAAFRTDEAEAYTMESGMAGKEDPPIHLAAGEGPEYNVRINYEGYHYMYACYLAPASEDPEGNHRYAYGVYWKKDKGEKIDGGLVITYATTLKYRQEKAKSHNDQALQSMVKSQGSQDNSDVCNMLILCYKLYYIIFFGKSQYIKKNLTYVRSFLLWIIKFAKMFFPYNKYKIHHFYYILVLLLILLLQTSCHSM